MSNDRIITLQTSGKPISELKMLSEKKLKDESNEGICSDGANEPRLFKPYQEGESGAEARMKMMRQFSS